jgi:hypothetical protein
VWWETKRASHDAPPRATRERVIFQFRPFPRPSRFSPSRRRPKPPDAQDDIAQVVLRLTGADDQPPAPLTPDEQAAIATSEAAAARGEFASDQQVQAVWAKHGL